MIKIAVSDIIDCMKNAYKSIDLRIAAGKEDDKWHNGLTVIRFSYQDKKSVENKIKGIESRIGEVKTDNFFISHHIFAFNELEELLSQFRAGKINLDDTEIDFMRVRLRNPPLHQPLSFDVGIASLTKIDVVQSKHIQF